MLVGKVHPGVESVLEEQPSKKFDLAWILGTPYGRGKGLFVRPRHESAVRMLGGEVITSM